MFLRVVVLLITAVLSGMKTVCCIRTVQGRDEPFWRVWENHLLYLSSVISMVVYVILWIVGKEKIYVLQFAELLYTYLLLTVTDVRWKKVPNFIVCMFLIAQILFMALQGTDQFVKLLPGGFIFSGVILAVALTSGGKIGIGDVKLLAATAFTAGWNYTLQVLCIAMVLTMVYGIGMMIFRHRSMKEELPFVPFLCAAMWIHCFCFLI